MSRIGFIGIGNMGKPMARNLLQAGHHLKVFDLSKKAQQNLAKRGAISAASLSDIVKDVDFVITMLPTGKEVKEIFLSPGFLSKAANNTIFIDCSTIDVESSLHVHSLVKQAGFGMIDAPVSGGTVGADQAILTFMCGGDEKTFEKCKSVLEIMGKKVVHCGGPSQGQVVKICNNMVAGSIFVVTSEALALGEKLGVDRKVIYDVISASSGNSWVLENACPLPGGKPGSGKDKEFTPGFSAQLMLKDLRLSQAAAQTGGSPTPLGAAATVAFQQHVNNGHGQLDTASICLLINPEIT